MKTLTEYIQQLLEQGYDAQRIQSYLQAQGYDQATISASINQAKQQERKGEEHSTQQSNLYQQLYAYVYQLLQQSYSPGQIYGTLQQQGYNQKVVQSVFTHINKEHYNNSLSLSFLPSPSHSSKGVFFIVIVLLIALLGFAGFYFGPQYVPGLFQGESFTIQDVDVYTETRMIEQGDSLSLVLDVNANKKPEQEQLDIIVTIETQEGLFVTRESPYVVLFDALKEEITITLPDNIRPGKYTAQIEVTNNDEQFDSTILFSVHEKTAPVDDEPSPINDDDDILDDFVSPSDTMNETTDAGNRIQTTPKQPPFVLKKAPSSYSRTDSKLYERAVTTEDTQQALLFCKKMTTSQASFECITTLARLHNNETLCLQATTAQQTDDCYIDLVLDGRMELCEEVTLSKNKQFCAELQLLQGVQVSSEQESFTS